MGKQRVTISIPEGLRVAAEKVMLTRHFDHFSEYVEALIRADCEQRSSSITRVTEPAAEYAAKRSAR